MFALLAGALLAGCSKPPSTSTASVTGSHKPPLAKSDSDEFHYNDPCSLLQSAQVAAALGVPLGTPPYRASNGNPVADGTDCIYQTATFQTVTLSVTYEGGQAEYHVGDFVSGIMKRAGAGVLSDKARQALVSEDGSQISGEWDEAKLTPLNCCHFEALRADQLISIDFTGSTLALKAAAALVDAAFKRIDKPLSLDGAANVAAATTFLKGRPRPMEPCSVLSAAEIAVILGTLASAPQAQGDGSCSYELPRQPGYPPRIYELQFSWHDGNYAFRQDLQAAKMGGAAVGGMQMQVTTQQQVPNLPSSHTEGAGSSTAATGAGGTHTVTTTRTLSVDEMAQQVAGQTFTQGTHLTGAENAADPGPWERSARVGLQFEAVRKDVLVKASSFAGDADKAKRLVSAAMAKF